MGQLRKVTDFWGGLAGPSRRLLVGAVFIFIVGLFLMMKLTGQVQYATLMSQVPTSDVAAIQQELDAAGIPNKLGDGASSIQVPQENLDQARVALASSPVGKAAGWELFDKSSFGETNYTQQIKFMRATKGELERTLTSIDQVQAANVNIAFPDKSTFSQEQKPTTASVVLTLAAGSTMDPEQVAGVTRLVAMAVPNLDPKNITITDTKGNLLEASAGTGVGAANTRLEVEAAFERQKQAQLEGLLAGIVGPGKAVVSYRATLDLDKTAVETETYNPKSKVPLEQNITKEKLLNTNGRTGAVVGATPNSPGNTFPAGGGNGNGRYQYDRTQDQVKNGVNRERVSSEKTPGTITSQSVAISVSDQVPAATYATLEDTIAKAIGYNKVRGDQISVSQVAFAADSPVVLQAKAEAPAAAEAKGVLSGPAFTPLNIAKTALAIIGGLLVLFLARKSLRRRQNGLESILPELLEQGPVPVAALDDPALPEGKRLMGIVKSPVEKQMEDLALRKPEDMAKLIRGWLAQR